MTNALDLFFGAENQDKKLFLDICQIIVAEGTDGSKIYQKGLKIALVDYETNTKVQGKINKNEACRLLFHLTELLKEIN